MTQSIIISSEELEIWVDNFFSTYMDIIPIAGATISIVQNNNLVLAKGYGYEDIEQKLPISAERTVFEVGQISQSFIATAIMQLIEKKLINLADDVNIYLQNCQIGDNYPQPVTIANLLTHTAGFEKCELNIHSLEFSNIVSLEEYLKNRIPKRIRLPGEVISYSNYDYVLLASIIESVTDISFVQYIRENILMPLEMQNSSFELPSDLLSNYRYDQELNIYKNLTISSSKIHASNALNTTAIDMAKFMIAHLKYGKFEHFRILAETTVKELWQKQIPEDLHLIGSCWNSAESPENKFKIVAVAGFQSCFCLFIDSNLGFFISTNTTKISEDKKNMNPLINYFLKDFHNYVEENSNYISRSKSLDNQKSLTKIQPLDYICKYIIPNYVLTLVYTYLWIFFGLLQPNLNFDLINLPESTRYKSIVLILVGVLIYQMLRPLFKGVFILIHYFVTLPIFSLSKPTPTLSFLTMAILVRFPPIPFLLSRLTVGLFLYLFIENIGIWQFSSSPLFFLISSYLTVIAEKSLFIDRLRKISSK